MLHANKQMNHLSFHINELKYFFRNVQLIEINPVVILSCRSTTPFFREGVCQHTQTYKPLHSINHHRPMGVNK